jgi:hypothetical protein
MVHNGILKRDERVIGLDDSCLHSGVAYALPEKVLTYLADAFHRQELLNTEIGEPSKEAYSVLYRSLHSIRPRGMHLFA